MDSGQETRLIAAVELLADAMVRIAAVHETRLAHEYPTPKEVRDVSISRIPTDDDAAKEGIGGERDQPLSRWLTDVSDDSTALGPRERAFQEAGDDEEGP